MKIKIEYEYDSKYNSPYFAYYINGDGNKVYFSSSEGFEKAKDKLIQSIIDGKSIFIPEPEEIEI